MDFLDVKGKNYIVFGVANKKSVAYHIAQLLEQFSANVIYVVHSKERKEELSKKLLKDKNIFICDVQDEDQIRNLVKITKEVDKIDGLVHSIAFANYSNQDIRFHKVVKKDFLQAVDISAFSFIRICNELSAYFSQDASIITISISTTRMASENYGYMGPIKAMLNSSVAFLAKSLSKVQSDIRVNAIGASLLKTSSSAGIPNYVKSYLYAEKVIPRKQALKTQEVANSAVFLLSNRSSGINAQVIIVDAGMEINFFDTELL